MLETILSPFTRLKKWSILLLVVSIALCEFLLLGRYSHFFDNIYLRLVIFLLFVLVGVILLKASGIQSSWGELLVASVLFFTFGYKIASYSSDVSAYPFSLDWSEGNRYYFASLFFSERIYGIQVPTSVLNPSQYLMQSIPFLIPNSPIWLHRAWQVFLWIATTLFTSALLARRLYLKDNLKRWMFITWTFLFLLLGPVLYNLQISVIIILLLFDSHRLRRSLGAVLLASIWAGISRINWFPVPGLLATTLFLLEQPMEKRNLWQYLRWSAIWVGLGTTVAFFSQTLYAVWSGNPLGQFTSSLTSDLLWYRLLPNPTYPTGVLPTVLFISFPFFLIITSQMWGRWNAYKPIRLLGLATILLVLFVGGLIVSTKIGGGNNPHNLDAYLVCLLIITAYTISGRFTSDQLSDQKLSRTRVVMTYTGLFFALLLPIYFSFTTIPKVDLPNQAEIERSLKRINRFSRLATEKGHDVLFIDERQLLTFGYIKSVPLTAEYEKINLTEMAMAGNEAHLSIFYDDLKNQRFGLIASEPLFIKYKGRQEQFGEENDVWAEYIAEPILCYYKPTVYLPEVRLWLLEPRANPRDCNGTPNVTKYQN